MHVTIQFNQKVPYHDGNVSKSSKSTNGLSQSHPISSFSSTCYVFVFGFTSLLSFSSVVVPIYLGELAPPALRGTLGTTTQLALVIGILASNLVAFSLSDAQGWRYMFGLTPILAAVDMVCLPLLSESPR